MIDTTLRGAIASSRLSRIVSGNIVALNPACGVLATFIPVLP